MLKIPGIMLMAFFLNFSQLTQGFAMEKNVSHLQQQIVDLTAHETAHFAVAYRDLGSGDSLFIDADTLMHAASTMKVAVMIEVFRQADQGLFNLDDSLLVKNGFASIVDGQPYAIELPEAEWDPTVGRLGHKMPIRELVLHMITVSSNLATNVLVDRVGASNIQATIRNLGTKHMQVLRGVEDPYAYEKGLNNRVTAADLAILLQAIAEHRAAAAAACDEMIHIMLQQKYRDCLPALLPAEVQVASKSGSITRICHDAGIILLPDGRRYVLVVLTRGEDNQKKSSDLIARISRLVYEYMVTKDSR